MDSSRGATARNHESLVRLLVQSLSVPARVGYQVERALRRCRGYGVHEDGNVRAVDGAVFPRDWASDALRE